MAFTEIKTTNLESAQEVNSIYHESRINRSNSIIKQILRFTQTNELLPHSSIISPRGISIFNFYGDDLKVSSIAYNYNEDRLIGAVGICAEGINDTFSISVGTTQSGISKMMIQSGLDTISGRTKQSVLIKADNGNLAFLISEEIRLTREGIINLPSSQSYLGMLAQEQERWKRLFCDKSYLGFTAGKQTIQPNAEYRNMLMQTSEYDVNGTLIAVTEITDFSLHQYVIGKLKCL